MSSFPNEVLHSFIQTCFLQQPKRDNSHFLFRTLDTDSTEQRREKNSGETIFGFVEHFPRSLDQKKNIHRSCCINHS